MHGKPEQLLELARQVAERTTDFEAVKGPGAGDRATLAFMRGLRQEAEITFGQDFSEKKLCGETALAVDFYFPDEATIVEVALGLPNPASEYEKDVLKAIMAQELGCRVQRLFFISRPGAAKRCSQPGRSAVKDWAKAGHNLGIEVHELGGEARAQRRHRRSSS